MKKLEQFFLCFYLPSILLHTKKKIRSTSPNA